MLVLWRIRQWLTSSFGGLPLRNKLSPTSWVDKDQLGKRGEQEAAAYLKKVGYTILDQGFETSFGELDIVALDDETIVYVEVKTRKSDYHRPELAVDRGKRKKIIKLAEVFAGSRGLLHHKSRFDVIAIVWDSPNHPPVIRHHKNAFRG